MPPMRIAPESGLARPVRRLIVVVLPAPLGRGSQTVRLCGRRKRFGYRDHPNDTLRQLRDLYEGERLTGRGYGKFGRFHRVVISTRKSSEAQQAQPFIAPITGNDQRKARLSTPSFGRINLDDGPLSLRIRREHGVKPQHDTLRGVREAGLLSSPQPGTPR
jgi:hypothetical protein